MGMTNTQSKMIARQAADPNYDAYVAYAAGVTRAEVLADLAEKRRATAMIQAAMKAEAAR